MTDHRNPDDYERAAGGLDYDDPLHDRAAHLGSSLASEGPQAIFDEIENLIPEPWKEHISNFPITAVLLGVGVGIWLGYKKGEDLLALGGSAVTAAVAANFNQVLGRSNEE